MRALRIRVVPIAIALLTAAGAGLTEDLAAQGNRDYRMPMRWNRLYDYDEIVVLMTRITTTWPKFTSMRSLGKSTEGRDLWVLTINNPDTGDDRTKPAFYTDANIHGNEVQGAETNLYMAWYLLENYGHLPRVTELVDDAAFYVVPSVNVDGRAAWFREPNTSSSERAPHKPYDDDLDGRFDEDPAEDLNGDGEITRMRKRVEPGKGQWRESKDYPGLMERTRDGDGDFVLLGLEGIDNDGDGRINEDGPGYYDMNRNWPSSWNPNHLQRGAGEYPLSHPETRCIAEFILDHPNIAGVQAFHNAGGMILRGPGLKEYGTYPRADRQVYDALGADGEFVLPYYRYMVIHKDLYSVAGGFVNWTYEGLGIFSFTNEMWTAKRMMQSDASMSSIDRRKWEDLLTMGESSVPWTEYEHPEYGTVEIGGARKMTGRVPPPWLMEEGAHRNAMFNLLVAREMPKVELIELEVQDAPGGLHYVDVKAKNHGRIPTRSALAASKGVGIPDRLTLKGDGIRVIAGGVPQDRWHPERINLQERDPATLRGESGVPGEDTWHVRWIVAGIGPFEIVYTAEKAVDRRLRGAIR